MVISSTRGWIRILESSIAVMIVIGVLLFSYASRPVVESSGDDQLVLVLDKLLSDIVDSSELNEWFFRGASLNNDKAEDYIRSVLPSSYDFSLVKCDVGLPCKLPSSRVSETLDKSIIARDTVLFDPTLQDSTPVKIKLFVWLK